MTYREQFLAIMNYEENHTMPVCHWTGWEETLERWYAEGMPRGVNEQEYFNARTMWDIVWPNVGLYPAYEEEVIEETPEYRIFRDVDGVVCKDWKGRSCIPHYIDFTFKTAKDWPEYKKRLQPHPDRIPKDIHEQAANLIEAGNPVAMWTGSMMGWARNWMGVEGMSYLMYDDPDVYADIVDTISDLVCWAADIVLPIVRCDMGYGWEDICGKSGPLVSPNIFKKCVAPGYRKIRAKLEEYGIKFLGIDTDGDITDLIGHCLDAGVNFHFPIEVGTWNGDAWKLRQKYGRELRMTGNFDKRVIEKGSTAVDAEIERLMPVIKDGGFLLLPDHLILPTTSLADYKSYLDRIRSLRF